MTALQQHRRPSPPRQAQRHARGHLARREAQRRRERRDAERVFAAALVAGAVRGTTAEVVAMASQCVWVVSMVI